MDISQIQESLFTKDYEITEPPPPGAEPEAEPKVVGKVSVTWDRNLFTGELDRHQGRVYADQIREVDRRIKELFPILVQRAEATGQGSSKRRRTSAKKVTTKLKAVAPPPAPPEVPADQRLLKMADDFEKEKEMDALLADVTRYVLADSLACDRFGIVKAWGFTSGGKPLEPNFEVLFKQPTPFLQDLLQWCRDESLPKSRRTPRVKTTSDSTEGTSQSGQATPTAGSPST